MIDDLAALQNTPEGRALLEKWEKILTAEGLSMRRAKRPPRHVSFDPERHDSVVCSKCTDGFHTEEGDCSYFPSMGGFE